MKVDLGALIVCLVIFGGIYALIVWAEAGQSRQCVSDGGKIVVSVGRAICVTHDGRVVGR